MRFLVLYIVIFLAAVNVNGQIEKERVKLVIPADTSAVTPPADAPTPNTLDKKLDNKSIFDQPNLIHPKPLIDRDKDLGFGKKNNLLRAGQGTDLEQRINKQVQREDEGMVVFKRNQFLGDIKTESGKVKIVYRDHQLEDGDLIRIIINDEVVQYRVMLTNMSKSIEVFLKDGFNKVDFKALNQGTSGPNTAEFRVYDDAGNLLSAKQWNLATGYKASIIIVKEVE